MNSILLQIASRYVRVLLILFAVIALFRGHNFPGGGFIGGLLAGLSVVFKGYAYTVNQVKENLKLMPEFYIGAGLFAILTSLVPGIIRKEEIMSGVWYKLFLPVFGEIKLGTPLLFDFGIFLIIIGVTILFLFSLTKNS